MGRGAMATAGARDLPWGDCAFCIDHPLPWNVVVIESRGRIRGQVLEAYADLTRTLRCIAPVSWHLTQ